MRTKIFLCFWFCAYFKAQIIIGNCIPAAPVIGYLTPLENNTRFIRDFMTFDNLPLDDVRRHYAIFIGVLDSLVQYFNHCEHLDYEEGYLPVLDKMVPVYWREPRKAMARMNTISDKILNFTTPINEFVHERCTGLSDVTCSMFFSAAAQELGLEPAGLLLELTHNFEMEFMRLEEQLIKAVSDYNELALLIRGKEELRPLVEQGALIYKTLYNGCLETVHEV